MAITLNYWQFGKPIPTGAVLEQLEFSRLPIENELMLNLYEDKTELSLSLEPEDALYGLGQNLGGLNKRGRVYHSYCTDDPHHTEDKTTLYAAHNFFIVFSKNTQAWYIDFPGKVTFDVGYTHPDRMTITIFGTDFSLYKFEGSMPIDVIKAFRKLIGKPYMPPIWALGYFQSRWGYASECDLLEVSEAFKTHDIPLEGIYVDIDYMERFKDFTIDTTRYPDFKGLVKRYKEQGQYLIPIIDAGVKIEPDYPLYEEGIEGDHFVKDQTGKPYVAAVWPGRVHFPDFFKEETRKWFGDWYRFLIDQGIVGIWNDMNEPAIFYDETALSEAIKKAKASEGQNLDIYTYFELGDAFRGLSNQKSYYERMQHDYNGTSYSNDMVHNLYGYFMTQSAYEGFERLLPNQRPLILSRASHVGMHRYGGIWTGDNSSWWSHLALNLHMLPGLSMVGFLYSGADTGGFGGNCSAELLSRWLQLSVFTPLLRNHAALGTRHQEPYQFSHAHTRINRELIHVRYRLVPFLYSELLKAYHEDLPLFTPLCFHYGDQRSKTIENQLMLGDVLMIAPVLTANQRGRMVYLPEPMTLVQLREFSVVETHFEQGDHFIDYPLDQVQFFIKSGSMVPIVKSALCTAKLQWETLEWIKSDGSQLDYLYYDDDGQTKASLKNVKRVHYQYSSVCDSVIEL